MAFRTVLLLSIITLNNSQSSKENFKPEGVTSGVCLRVHRKAEGGSIWSKEIDNKCVFVSMVVRMFGTVGSMNFDPRNMSIFIRNRRWVDLFGLNFIRINGSGFLPKF
jgi:hypothetical protein